MSKNDIRVVPGAGTALYELRGVTKRFGDFTAANRGGRALAVIDITDDMSSYQIPLGAAAQVAIYTEYWHHVSMIRKILLRMRSWQNYIFLEGH